MRNKLGQYVKGNILPESTIAKISFTLKGRKLTKEHIDKLRIASSGSRNAKWKGDKASYGSIHFWVVKRLGKPLKCEHCKCEGKKYYDWANKDHKYKRVLEDWIRLCRSCHRKYDYKNNRKLKNNCRNGHLFTVENTYIYRGLKLCKSCKNMSLRNWRARQKISNT